MTEVLGYIHPCCRTLGQVVYVQSDMLVAFFKNMIHSAQSVLLRINAGEITCRTLCRLSTTPMQRSDQIPVSGVACWSAKCWSKPKNGGAMRVKGLGFRRLAI